MNKRPRGTLIVFVLLIALVAVGRYFGWLADPTPVLAPGIQ